MQCILHIGYNKTGTSSIQNFLERNREALRSQGLFYPGCGIFDSAHYGVSRFLVGQPRSELVEAGADLPQRLRAEIAASGCSRVVISSEYFVLADPKQVAATRKFLDELGAASTRIVLYLRRHDEWFESLFNQALKTVDGASYEMDIRDYVLRILGGSNPPVRYLKTIDRWAKAFGEESMAVRPFERAQFRNGDLVADFLGVIDPDLKLPAAAAPLRQNESLDGGRAYLIGLLRRMPVSEHRNAMISHTLRMREAEVPFAPKDFGKLSPAIRRSLLRFFQDEYAQIARKFLGRKDGKLFRNEVE
jgi:hypothetical protein